MSSFKELLHQYAERLKDREEYFKAEVQRLEYFQEHPLNDTAERVRQKLSVLNHHQIHDLNCHEEMVKHILDLSIDKALAENELSVVQKIAKFHIRGKDYDLLSFASNYCNSHKPAVYPIFGTRRIAVLEKFMRDEGMLTEKEHISDYQNFVSGLKAFLKAYELDKLLNYYEVGKLSWLYLDKLLAEID